MNQAPGPPAHITFDQRPVSLAADDLEGPAVGRLHVRVAEAPAKQLLRPRQHRVHVALLEGIFSDRDRLACERQRPLRPRRSQNARIAVRLGALRGASRTAMRRKRIVAYKLILACVAGARWDPGDELQLLLALVCRAAAMRPQLLVGPQLRT
jgi:hypothetical protein